MADNIPIIFALYGFAKDQEPIMQAAFAHADQWATPWVFTETLQDARVIIVDLDGETDFDALENLKQRLPKAEIVALAAKKPPQAKWHLQRQPNGKVSIVGFSQLVLKISHTLKKNITDGSEADVETMPSVGEPEPAPAMAATLPDICGDEASEQEPDGMLAFFNQLDSVLETKPHEKRKRFNES